MDAFQLFLFFVLFLLMISQAFCFNFANWLDYNFGLAGKMELKIWDLLQTDSC